MPSYLVEAYAPASGAAQVEAALARLAAGPEAVRHPARHLRAEDDT